MPDKILGYIGLGSMGRGMAANLLASGHEVIVYDVNEKAVQRLVDKGAISAKSPKDVASQADINMTCLVTSEIVEQVATGPEGILEGVSPGNIYIDMSTIDPDTTRRIGKAMNLAGVEMLDVPVGNGPQEAADGTLIMIIGGDTSVVESCEYLLDIMGSEKFYCGPLGNGTTAKIVNNLVTCTIGTLLAEAFTLGRNAGLNLSMLREIMQRTGARTPQSKTFKNILSEDLGTVLENALHNTNDLPDATENLKQCLGLMHYAFIHRKIMHKDLGLAARLASSLESSNLVGSAAYQMQDMAMSMGFSSSTQQSED